uniref:Haloacid dehalogenase-like hydrolase domain-containing protein 2 n=1 Tax=Peromyscus maniculatus bairdii TaxID=230844 RepID=A0A8C8UHP9_PERMB
MAACRALKAVLVDLSGTLHIEDAAVPDAHEALKRQAILQVQMTNTFLIFCSHKICFG